MEDGDFVADSDVDDGTESDELARPTLAPRNTAAPAAPQPSREEHEPVAPPHELPLSLHTNGSDGEQQQSVDARPMREQRDTDSRSAETERPLPRDAHTTSALDTKPQAQVPAPDASVHHLSATSTVATLHAPASESRVRVFQVGDLVEVESRTWPGINKPGGSGRVAKVHRETTATGDVHVFYDVRYVLGGFEKRIESAYVELSHILELARAQGRVRYERVFYHEEFADAMHKKKKTPVYDQDAGPTPSSRRTHDEHLTADGRAVETAKRRTKRSRRDRTGDGSSSNSADRHRRNKSVRSDEHAALEVPIESDSGSASRASDDSDSSDDERHVIRKIGDQTFLMDTTSRDATEHESDAVKWRRRRPIIESDGSDSGSSRSGAESSDHRDPQSTRHQRESNSAPSESYRPVSDLAPLSESRSSSHSTHSKPTRVRPSKKRRRYVGGYLHRGDDVDATFIQPEDNANALPDDVARELGFKLGKTKAELRAQLATIAQALTANLRTFDDERASVTQLAKRAPTLTLEELTALHQQAAALERFLTQELIRRGEDVMNAVIVKLTRKGGSLPDSVELVFDDQKRAISDHGVWIRKVRASLETAFKVRSVPLPAESRTSERTERVASAPSNDSDLDASDDASAFESSGYSASRERDDRRSSAYRSDSGASSSRSQSTQRRSLPSSPRRSAGDRYSRKRSQKIDAFMASHGAQPSRSIDHRQSATTKYRASTTLDDFEFVQYGASPPSYDAFQDDRRARRDASDAVRASNVRLPGKKKQSMELSDPRWNWFQMGKLKEQATARRKPASHSSGSSSVSGVTTQPLQRAHKRQVQEKLIGSVQSARLHLRERRLQSARGPAGASRAAGALISRAYGLGYDPPPQSSGSGGGGSVMIHDGRRESMRTDTSFSYEDASVSAKSSSRGSGRPRSSAAPSTAQPPPVASAETSTLEAPALDWTNVFDVLTDTVDDDASGLRPLRSEARSFLLTCGLVQCTCGHHSPQPLSATDERALLRFSTDDGEAEATDDSNAMIERLAMQLRQSLTSLRLHESAVMASLPGTAAADAQSESVYTASREWQALVAAADRYHSSLAQLVQVARACVRDAIEMRSSAFVEALVRVVVAEVAATLAQLPDCEALFDTCRAYVFFFEVADRDATTTPLVTAIARTYWYSIALLLDIRAAAATLQAIDATAERVLPTNRAILAASLFLVDLYLYLPSSHRLEPASLSSSSSLIASPAPPEQPPSDTATLSTFAPAPALSLWLLLYDCFATGKCSFQTGKLAGAGDGRDFWAFVQTMYRDHFVDHLAIAFTQARSSGGYLVDSLPKLSTAREDAEDVAQGQLLALQSVWRLSLLFAQLFAPALDANSVISEARWAVAKDLLQPGKPAFLPFDSRALARQSQEVTELRVYSSVFKLQVLQNVLALSKVSSPQSDVVERLLDGLWDDTSAATTHSSSDSRALTELSLFWRELLLQTASLEHLRAFVRAWKPEEASDSVDLISAIVLVQILTFERAIHRSRYRQPICRAIAARLDVTKSGSESLAVAPAPAVVTVHAHDKAVVDKPKTWNWGSSSAPTATTDAKAAANAPKPTPVTPRGPNEERLMVSILLALAVASVCADAGPAPSLALRAPTQRSNKSLKRDLEFYTKEMARIVQDNAVRHSALLSQALYVTGCVAMAHSNEYAVVFAALNDLLLASVQRVRAQQRRAGDSDAAGSRATAKHEMRLLERGALSTLYVLRDLTRRLVALIPQIPVPQSSAPAPPPQTPSSSLSSYALDAVSSSLSSVLNTGLEACLDAAVDDLLPIDALHVALEILQLVVPRAPDTPTRCLQVLPVPAPSASGPSGNGTSEFDEFGDLDMDDVFASVDLDTLASGRAAPTTAPATLATFADAALQATLTHLRLALQRVVIKYPVRGLVSYYELFAIELLGRLVSTCSFAFAWSLVSGASLKPRVLAPRLLSAILKYNGEKEWFSTCFLSESGADQELATLWLTGTLDLQALFPALCALQSSPSDRFVLPVVASDSNADAPASLPSIRYANYWLVLTDAIIYNVVRENPVAQYKMDPLVLALVRSIAQNCTFTMTMREQQQPPSDAVTLYALHLNAFQEFCRSAGAIWRSLATDASQRRAEMHRFRSKMMDVQSGVFAAFPETYEMNLKMVCQDLDRTRRNWYELSERFLRDFATLSSSTAPTATAAAMNLHTIDESLALAHAQLRDDPSVRVLIVLFQFTYACVDAFLFHCGAMAIGQQNIFFSVLQLLFRQASCAEFPQAETRLRQLELAAASQRGVNGEQPKWFDSAAESAGSSAPARQPQKASHGSVAKSISPACLGFVESVRLFFARQKYPSLLHWFAQTLETYQTLKRGWSTSPLRKLLLNVLDPHGPLGVHSYYPIDANPSSTSAFDVRNVRREAFYLSCGLFVCRCTSAYEHARAATATAAPSVALTDAQTRLKTLRTFILTDFVNESFAFASGDAVCLHETLVPLAQFVRAVVSHGNMNLCQHRVSSIDRGHGSSTAFDFAAAEVYDCLERIVLYCIKTFSASAVLQSSISCVLALELCGIVSETVILNDAAFDRDVSLLLELALAYFVEIYGALSALSSHVLAPVFAVASDSVSPFALPTTGALLATFRPRRLHGVDVVKTEAATLKAESSGSAVFDEYGISGLRVRADLVVSIARLAERCRQSTDKRLQRFMCASTDG